MKIEAPELPYILPPLNDRNSGVDFLGLRQANLDMMADAIPSINNVTFYIRPFSLLAWIYWKFYELCRDAGIEETDSDKLREFRERIEILFTWGARQATRDYGRIPGTSPEPPATGRATVPLTFEAWGRNQGSTSLVAALWYGPGSKTVTGLGFIAPHPQKASFFRTTDYAGLPIAKALDAKLQKSDRYPQLLATLETVEATAEDARALWDYWRPDDITADEQEAFFAALFNEEQVGDQTSLIGKRSSTLALARFHLEQAGKPLAVDEIRRGMFLAATPEGETYELPENLADARKKWQFLQIRQLQRYAMETLLSWCEMQILYERVREPSILAQALESEWRESAIFRPQAESLSDLLEELEAGFDTSADFLEACRRGEVETPFEIMENIQTHFQRGDPALAPWCIYGMLICFLFAALHQDAAEQINVGGPTRVSLKSLYERLNRIQSLPLQDALRYILEAMIISQHFATAVNRFDGQSQRLRLAIEETGIEPLVSEPWTPTITEDRLATLLSLAQEAGVINRKDSNTFVATSA